MVLPVLISVVIISYNEEANIRRTLESVRPLVQNGRGEVIVVDSGSSDRTVAIAGSFGAKVFVEKWKGYAAQKNSAIDKANGDWILSLDADEELEVELSSAIGSVLSQWDEIDTYARSKGYSTRDVHSKFEVKHELDDAQSFDTDLYYDGFWLRRKNHFLGRWMRRGGYWPDLKLRLFRRSKGRFEDRTVHETLLVNGETAPIHTGSLVHYCYPTLSDYIDHMNRYSSLGAEMAMAKRRRGFSLINIVVRPALTFVYNYFLRVGFLDGREGLLLHMYHAAYVSWKYAKAWEMGRDIAPRSS